MTKRQIELLIESIGYHQLHLQKMYEQHVDVDLREYLTEEHEELCKISKILIKELDNYDKKN